MSVNQSISQSITCAHFWVLTVLQIHYNPHFVIFHERPACSYGIWVKALWSHATFQQHRNTWGHFYCGPRGSHESWVLPLLQQRSTLELLSCDWHSRCCVILHRLNPWEFMWVHCSIILFEGSLHRGVCDLQRARECIPLNSHSQILTHVRTTLTRHYSSYSFLLKVGLKTLFIITVEMYLNSNLWLSRGQIYVIECKIHLSLTKCIFTEWSATTVHLLARTEQNQCDQKSCLL